MPWPPQPATSADWPTAAYDYYLPPGAIAQQPVEPRDQSRLLAIDPQGHQHRVFRDLPALLQPGDLLVLNDTQVIPARLHGHKSTGGAVEVLLLEPADRPQNDEQSAAQAGQAPETDWLALVKPGKRIRPGHHLHFGQGLTAEVLAVDEATSGRWLRFRWPGDQDWLSLLRQIGEAPLPPYVREAIPFDRYQTVWATQPGAIAAPTASLHFTPDLLQQLAARGVGTTTLTLHVGLGTFRPVEVADLRDHPLHHEWLTVPAATVQKIQATQQHGGRVIGVGTTVARALETAAQSGTLQPWTGKSNLFLYPGYRWQVLDGLVTNFHLPQSSLLMLVSALIGRSRLLELYQEAIQEGYRFYSLGDSMLIYPALPSHF